MIPLIYEKSRKSQCFRATRKHWLFCFGYFLGKKMKIPIIQA